MGTEKTPTSRDTDWVKVWWSDGQPPRDSLREWVLVPAPVSWLSGRDPRGPSSLEAVPAQPPPACSRPASMAGQWAAILWALITTVLALGSSLGSLHGQACASPLTSFRPLPPFLWPLFSQAQHKHLHLPGLCLLCTLCPALMPQAQGTWTSQFRPNSCHLPEHYTVHPPGPGSPLLSGS